jgi:hypothetical protein
MIEINLLPLEYRPVERTPLPRRLTIFAGVLLACSGAAICAWLFFVKIPEARTQLANAQQQAEKKKVEKLEVESKEAEIRNLDVRANILRGLQRDRLPWAKVLDRLADARSKVDSIVLTGLDLKRGPAGGPIVAGRPREVSQLDVKGLVISYDDDPQSDRLRADYLRFVEVLRNDKAFADIFDSNVKIPGDRMNKTLAPSGAGAKDANLPKAGLEFELIFTFKPPTAPAPATPAAAGRP